MVYNATMFHLEDFILIVAAFCAGALNSIAGGGSFITFPTLLFYGIPPVLANATNTVALFPGTLTAAWAYRKEFTRIKGIGVMTALGISLTGGLLGAWILLKTPESSFAVMIPYLLLCATLLFTFGKKISQWLHAHYNISQTAILTGLFLTAVYGGYFGGGASILILALLSLMGMENVNSMNSAKTALVAYFNSIAVALFIASDSVHWHAALIMMLGTTTGGFAGAFWARKTNQKVLRNIISLVGASLCIYYFCKTYHIGLLK